jgi:outer membrane protein
MVRRCGGVGEVAKARVNGYNTGTPGTGKRLQRFFYAPRHCGSYDHGNQMKIIPRYSVLIVFAMLCTQASAQSTPAGAQPIKIGYVNVTRIESESALAKQNIESLKKEFSPREKQLADMQKQGNELQADLEKNAATMPAAERQAKEKRNTVMLQQYQQMQRALAEDFEARKRETFAGFLTEVNTVIKNIAEAGKFDLIVQQAVYNSSQADITEQVMQEIAKRAASAGK